MSCALEGFILLGWVFSCIVCTMNACCFEREPQKDPFIRETINQASKNNLFYNIINSTHENLDVPNPCLVVKSL